MKLVAAKCPNCGANIDVDANSDSTKCEYCNTKILVDDAIEKLRVEIKGEVEVKNLPKASSYLKNGARYYKNGEYGEAYKQYNKAIELEPDNYIAVLRNGICNSLDTNYFGYNLNPLQNGVRESSKILKNSGEDVDDSYFDQIANEGFEAALLMEKFAINFYNKGLCDYSDMIDNLQKLLDCSFLYADLENIAKDKDIKKKILKKQVDLFDLMIDSRKYRTGRYKNGREIIGTFVPPKNIEKEMFELRTTAVNKYNNLVEPSEQLVIKKQPVIRWDGPLGKSIIFIVIFLIVFIFLAVKMGLFRENGPKSYDYVQDCNGLEYIKLSEVYHAYNSDKEAVKNQYGDKAFSFEGKIFRIDYDKNMIQVDSDEISPEVYINNNEIEKIEKYKVGDNIRMCGLVKFKNTIISVPFSIENATIIE